MVKANELRVGNWLWYKSDMYSDRENKVKENWFQVAYIGETIGLDIGFECTQRFEKKPLWSPKIKELKPIPLTPEILQQYGFVKSDTWWGDGIDYYHYPIPNLPDISKSVDIRFGNEAVEGILDAVFVGQQDFKHVRSLHQLQNLYFALTNEELNFTSCKQVKTISN